jgi:putative SOS response-associated peptidase YedK
MCGRYTITTPSAELAEYFGAALPSQGIEPRTNAAPSQSLPVILDSDPKQIVYARWGYPMRIKQDSSEFNMINVRAETIEREPYYTKKPNFGRRCLVLADGFYEWMKQDAGKKIPFHFIVGGKPIAFAGIYQWSERKGVQEPLFAIVTVPPNELVRKIHNRMPAILERHKEKRWLAADPDDYRKLLKPFEGKMAAKAASPLMNDPKNENPSL